LALFGCRAYTPRIENLVRVLAHDNLEDLNKIEEDGVSCAVLELEVLNKGVNCIDSYATTE
jgi:hypothetical protein